MFSDHRFVSCDLSSPDISEALMHLLIIQTFPVTSKEAVTLPDAGEERGRGVVGGVHSGQRATVALSVLLMWPKQPSH